MMQVKWSPRAHSWIHTIFSCVARRYYPCGLQKTSAWEALLAGLPLGCQGDVREGTAGLTRISQMGLKTQRIQC